MKAPAALALILNLWACVSFAQISLGFRAAANTWEIASSQKASSQEAQSAFNQMLAAWERLPQNHKEIEYPRLALAYIERSESDLASHDASEAARQLKTAGTLFQRFGGRIEYATKSLNAFFERLAKLQAAVAQATGTDPLSGMTNYLFRQQGDKYIVARQELDPEVKGITVDGVTEGETLAQVLEVSAQDGQALLEKTRWVIGPKGKVEETLRRATREVSFDEDGRLSAKPLSTPVFVRDTKGQEAAPPQSPATPAPTTTTLTATPAPSLPAPMVAETPAATVEQRAPVWPWVVGILALVVVIALALKRRA